MKEYKILFSGFAYVHAGSEEAEEMFFDGEGFYQNMGVDEIEEIGDVDDE